MSKLDKLSVFISLVLRHKPDAAGINLDEHGWANVQNLIDGIKETGRKIDMGILYKWRLIIAICAEHGRFATFTYSCECASPGGLYIWQLLNARYIEEIVETDNKQRYTFNQDKTMIRANQGHSIPVDVELKEQEPPEFLYHGTATRFLDAILNDGLKPMSRLYVHLSEDIETALKVGKRHGNPVVLKIYSGDMYKDGYKFYLSENGVWLTKKVDVKYIEK